MDNIRNQGLFAGFRRSPRSTDACASHALRRWEVLLIVFGCRIRTCSYHTSEQYIADPGPGYHDGHHSIVNTAQRPVLGSNDVMRGYTPIKCLRYTHVIVKGFCAVPLPPTSRAIVCCDWFLAKMEGLCCPNPPCPK
jgi:hypothetical protein